MSAREARREALMLFSPRATLIVAVMCSSLGLISMLLGVWLSIRDLTNVTAVVACLCGGTILCVTGVSWALLSLLLQLRERVTNLEKGRHRAK